MGKFFCTRRLRGETDVKSDPLEDIAHIKSEDFLDGIYGKTGKGRLAAVFVIGKDTRRSSYIFGVFPTAGLRSVGLDLYHVTTFPGVSHVIRTEDFDCGIMISTSRNPTMTMASRSWTETVKNSRRR